MGQYLIWVCCTDEHVAQRLIVRHIDVLGNIVFVLGLTTQAQPSTQIAAQTTCHELLMAIITLVVTRNPRRQNVDELDLYNYDYRD